MFEIIAIVLIALVIVVFYMGLCGALYGLGLWGIWWILVEVGVIAATPVFWPCWAIGCILWLIFGGSKTINIKY